MRSLSLTATLVLYHPDLQVVARTLRALEAAGHYAAERLVVTCRLTLVDNSADLSVFEKIGLWVEQIRSELPNWELDLLRAPENLGYGRGNNLVIQSAVSDYHLVINPDLFVREDALHEALCFMEENPETGLLVPAVFSEDGERQYLCKRNPTLLIMFLRSFAPEWLRRVFRSELETFEMRDCDYEREIHPVEYPTGCFMFFRTASLKVIGGFDPEIFLHYEDADIGRRMLGIARVCYVPAVVVTHRWARDTYKSLLMKWITIKSGFYYWKKWRGLPSLQEVPLVRRLGCGDATALPNRSGKYRVLVTGANGFVGKSVCRDLLESGYDVLGVVRQLSKTHHPADPQCEYRALGNFDEHTDWSSALRGVDVVVHLAARVHVMEDGVSNPLAEYRRINVDLTMNLANQAASVGVRRFVFLSSIKVNGENTKFGQPFTAEDVPHPEDSYGISKLEAEQALLELSRVTAMEVVIIRPPLVYGPGVKANFEAMMRLLCRSLPLPLAGLTNRRSLVSINNLVDLSGYVSITPEPPERCFWSVMTLISH